MVEVGSGFGYLLKSFKDEGWDMLGVDPWRAASLFTQEAHGITTIPATLEEAKLPDASTDVIVLLHVIEHVPDPHATLSEINRVLKPGGHLVMETPRYDTVMFRLLGHQERRLRCEGHIYFFTLDSLRRAYEKVGFSEVETRAVGHTLSMDRLLWNVGTVAGSEKVREGLRGLGRKTGRGGVKFTLNLRDMQWVIVHKDA
jgi:SAM-dependent methyltransferase